MNSATTVGADLRVCPGIEESAVSGRHRQVCPHAGLPGCVYFSKAIRRDSKRFPE